jgi:hypothetical protein
VAAHGLLVAHRHRHTAFLTLCLLQGRQSIPRSLFLAISADFRRKNGLTGKCRFLRR